MPQDDVILSDGQHADEGSFRFPNIYLIVKKFEARKMSKLSLFGPELRGITK